MRVNVRRGSNIGMPQKSLHKFQVPCFGVYKTSRQVPEAMKPRRPSWPRDVQTIQHGIQNILPEHIRTQGCKGRDLKLDEEGKYKLLPDISCWTGDSCRFIADAKYKDIDSKEPPSADIYQMLAYCTATQLQSGLLI
jgi:hypothetical protein